MTRDHQDNAPLDPLSAAEHWLQGGEPVALATVIAAWGSAPVPIGGQMVIASGERFQGSVSGGCIEADVIAEAADVLALEDVPDSVRSLSRPSSGGYQLAGRSLEEVERDLIEANLKLTHENREQAAKILGIGERTLYRKLKDYGVS